MRWEYWGMPGPHPVFALERRPPERRRHQRCSIKSGEYLWINVTRPPKVGISQTDPWYSARNAGRSPARGLLSWASKEAHPAEAYFDGCWGLCPQEEEEEAVQGKGRNHAHSPRLPANYPPSGTRRDVFRGRKDAKTAHQRTPPASDFEGHPWIQPVLFRPGPVSPSFRP